MAYWLPSSSTPLRISPLGLEVFPNHPFVTVNGAELSFYNLSLASRVVSLQSQPPLPTEKSDFLRLSFPTTRANWTQLGSEEPSSFPKPRSIALSGFGYPLNALLRAQPANHLSGSSVLGIHPTEFSLYLGSASLSGSVPLLLLLMWPNFVGFGPLNSASEYCTLGRALNRRQSN
jgi:hypothetical protein